MCVVSDAGYIIEGKRQADAAYIALREQFNRTYGTQGDEFLEALLTNITECIKSDGSQSVYGLDDNTEVCSEVCPEVCGNCFHFQTDKCVAVYGGLATVSTTDPACNFYIDRDEDFHENGR